LLEEAYAWQSVTEDLQFIKLNLLKDGIVKMQSISMGNPKGVALSGLIWITL
jgi:hypothetical protein